jgi:hypothetical protein
MKNNFNSKRLQFVAKSHDLKISQNLKLINTEKNQLGELSKTQKLYQGYSKLLTSKHNSQLSAKVLLAALKQEREFVLFCEVLNKKVTKLSQELSQVVNAHHAKIKLLVDKSQSAKQKRSAILDKLKQIQRLQKEICENNELAELEDNVAFKSTNNYEH